MQGFRDDQLLGLTRRVLANRHIWCLNVGENYGVHMSAWQYFKNELPNTAVAYLYVSEHHLKGTKLKDEMRDAIRLNRKCVRCAVRQRVTCWQAEAFHSKPTARQLSLATSRAPGSRMSCNASRVSCSCALP